MAIYTRTVNYIRFDPTTATLTISVDSYKDSVYVGNTGEIPCVLPVDNSGSVPAGSDLTDFVEAFAAGVVQPDVIDSAANLVAAGGLVSNAQDVYTLTMEAEPGETPGLEGYGLPVVIYPDRVYTPSGNVFTRSVIACVADSYAAPTGGRFPTAYQISQRLGDTNSILDNGNVYTDPWPADLVETTVASAVFMTPITSFQVSNPAGIHGGMIVFIPTYNNYVTVDSVVGTTVNFTSSFTVTPNFVSGTALSFRGGSVAKLSQVFDDSYVYGVDPTPPTVTVCAYGGLQFPTIPSYIDVAYPRVFGGAAMLDDQTNNAGANFGQYLSYFYVVHEPITITSSTGYAWFQYS